MNIIYFLIPIAMLLAFGFIAACIWALTSGQFDDLETPAFRILKDENKNLQIKLINKKGESQ